MLIINSFNEINDRFHSYKRIQKPHNRHDHFISGLPPYSSDLNNIEKNRAQVKFL